MSIQIVFDLVLSLDIIPVELVGIVASYYSCSDCTAIRDRIHELAYCNFLRIQLSRSLYFFSLRFSLEHGNYYMTYNRGQQDPIRLLIDLDSLTSAIIHNRPLMPAIEHYLFPNATDPESHTLHEISSSNSQFHVLMTLIIYQVTRCPALRLGLHNMGYDHELQRIASMNDTSSSGSGSSGDYITRLPNGSYPLINPSHPLCTPDCPHRMPASPSP